MIGVTLEYTFGGSGSIVDISEKIFSNNSNITQNARYTNTVFFNLNDPESRGDKKVCTVASSNRISELYYRESRSTIDFDISLINVDKSSIISKYNNSSTTKKINIYIAVPAYLSPSFIGSM
jgi:hypothetical protein